MAKGHSDHQHHDTGTPTYIIMSVLFAIVIFALEGIKETIVLSAADSQTRATTLGFIGLGLSICFFWRRLHDSLFKSLTALFFTASLWAYLVATVALPLLANGEEVSSRLQLIHQCGLGGVVIAGFCLMAALLYHQKPVPALLMTTLSGFLVGFGSLYPLLRPGSVTMQSDFAIENRSHAKKSEAAEEEVHGKAEGHAVAEEHEEHGAAHEAEPEDDGHGHGKAKAKAHAEAKGHGDHEDEHAAPKKAKMKLSARAAVEDEHDEDEKAEARLHKALKEDHDHEDAEEEAPRTLTAAQKAKLERAKNPVKKTAAAHGKPKMALAAKHVPAYGAAKPAPAHGTHWEYSGDLGPTKWAALDDKFKACGEGYQQSPININSRWTTGSYIRLNYKDITAFEVVDTGHVIQVNVKERGNFAYINDRRYELKQFHFHTPSEHLVDGKSFPMEVHFVHADDDGKLAVIGAFIVPGTPKAGYNLIAGLIPKSSTNSPLIPLNQTLQLASLLPSSLESINYYGSLTTPPCSEGVNWNVLYSAVSLTSEQIKLFQSKYKMNARPTQPMHYRKLDTAASAH